MNLKEFADQIECEFKKEKVQCEIFVFGNTDSTNTRAKEYAKENKSANNVFFIAQSQSCGRGTRGRSFISDDGGLYISYLLRPSVKADEAIRLTAYSAVALLDAILEITGVRCGIKWVNDLFIDGKKVAGILTEGAFCDGGECFEYAVVGVGLNVASVNFCQELSFAATDLESVTGRRFSVAKIAAALAKRLIRFDGADPLEYMARYRDHSVVIGKKVLIASNEGKLLCTVKDICDDGSLVVIDEAGEENRIVSGDVSLRRLD